MCLGNTTFDIRLRPLRLDMQNFKRSPAVMVACGDFVTMVLTAGGLVWNCGLGDSGELGHNDFDSKFTLTLMDPTRRFHDARIEMIAAGDCHAMALDTSAQLWTWGSNQYGQLCHNKGLTGMNAFGQVICSRSAEPVLLSVETFKRSAVVSMDGGKQFTMVVTADGVLWACGYGKNGQLGTGRRENINIAWRVGDSKLFGKMGVKMAVCGNYHSLILTKNNQVFSCGQGQYANVGCDVKKGHVMDLLWPTLIHPEYFDNQMISTAAVGAQHSAVVTEEGRVNMLGMLVDREGLPDRRLFDHNLSQDGVEQGMTMELKFRLVPDDLLNGAHIGRRHFMYREHIIILAMALHCRLGANSIYNGLSQDLFKSIIDCLRFNPGSSVCA